MTVATLLLAYLVLGATWCAWPLFLRARARRILKR